MAIEIVDKLKPMNNGSFSLMDAVDIVLSDGRTLQDYIDNFDGSSVNYDELLEQIGNTTACNLYYNEESKQLYLLNANDAKIGDSVEISTSSDSLSKNLTMKTTIDSELNVFLILLCDDVEICRTLLPAMGGSGSSTTMKLTNTMGTTLLSYAVGTDVNLRFYFSSILGTEDTGDGMLEVTVNNKLVQSRTIQQGDNSVDVTNYVVSDTNTVKITVTDSTGTEKSITYTINMIQLSITSTFDNTYAYSGDVLFKYTPYGNVEKTIYVLVDGEVYSTETTSSYGRQMTTTISGLSHGEHKLSVYCTAVVDGVKIESNTLTFNILYYTDSNESTILTVYSDVKQVTQGDLLSFKYLVYDPSSNPTNVKIYINNELQLSGSVNRSLQTWNTRNYPTGNVEFKFEVGNIFSIVTIEVKEAEINVEIVPENLALSLSSSGRSNSEINAAIWEYNGISTTFTDFNWVSNGWMNDASGDTALVLNSDARAVINYQPFKSDIKDTGMTFELEFYLNNINKRETTIISCIYNGIGIEITPDTAYFHSETSTVSCNFNEKSKIHIAFVVENRSENRLLSVYLNGILSNVVQYPSNDSFRQISPMNISIGSNDCEVFVYNVRVYNTDLDSYDIVNNYIADINDISTRIDTYSKNNIFNSSRLIQYNAVVERIPCMTIIGDLPQSKGDKKKAVIDFVDLQRPQLSFNESCTIDVQGTSSQYYVRKNYKLKFSEEITFDESQLPAKVYTMKADYAESTGTHNTQNANYIHTLYTSPTPPQEIEPKVRTTIYGYPVVIFHQANENAEKTFIGKYNFNYDKGAKNVFGFSSKYPKCESWEFLNNTDLRCLFLSDDAENLGDAFEARYPEDYTNYTNIHRVLSWVVSTKGDPITFRDEFEKYFNLEYTLIYYVYTFVMLMVDQRAKNMFLTTWDGNIWQPWFYDNDTCLGINNEGLLSFDYFHEDSDIIGTANVYNGQNSTLWINFKEAFADEIKETYQTLRNSGKLSADKLLDYFNINGSSKWSESIYNEDQNYKYIDLARNNDTTYLYMARGSASNHREYFIKNRINYCDSKWYASDYASDYATLRIYTPSSYGSVTPNADIHVTPYSNMYVGVRYKANGALLQDRGYANKVCTITAPDEVFNDTETSIYGASLISSLGDLSPLYCGTINVANCIKLKELIIGNSARNYENSNLTSLSLGSNVLLETIDITNCINLTSTINATGCTGIKHFYAKGTNISAVNLPEAGYIETLHLPSSIRSLIIKNQSSLNDFSMDGYNKITTLVLENVNSVVPVNTILAASYETLSRVRLINVNLSFEDSTIMEHMMTVSGIDENNNNSSSSIITGTCHFNRIGNQVLNTLHEYYPNLTFTFDTLEVQYTVTFLDWDNKVLKVQNVLKFESATPPSDPVRPPSGLMEYQFVGWEGNYTNVQKNETVIASYSSSIRKLTVRFLNYDNSILGMCTVNYGGNAVPPSDTPIRPSNDETFVYRFNGWDRSYNNITSDTDIHATYIVINQYKIRFLNGTEVMKTQLVLEGENATPPIAIPLKVDYIESTMKCKYEFKTWGDSYLNVHQNIDVQAEYTEYRYYLLTYNIFDGSDGAGLLDQIVMWSNEDLYEPDYEIENGYVYVYCNADETSYFAFPIYPIDETESREVNIYRKKKKIEKQTTYGSAVCYATTDKILIVKKGRADQERCMSLVNMGLGEYYRKILTIIVSEVTDIYQFAYMFNIESTGQTDNRDMYATGVYFGDMEMNLTTYSDLDLTDAGLEITDTNRANNCGCSNLRNLRYAKLSNRLNKLGSGFFAYISNGTDKTTGLLVKLPTSVKSLGIHCFNGTILRNKSVNIENITYFGNYCLTGCNIEVLNLGEHVTYVGEGVCQNCKSLTKLIWNSQQKMTPFRSFSNCTALETIEFCDDFETVGNQSFNLCSSLSAVNIPSGLKRIEGGAFGGTTSLTIPIHLPEGFTDFEGGFGGSNITEITLPTTVTRLNSEQSFGSMLNCKYIEIPDWITYARGRQFQGNTGIVKAKFPWHFTSVGNTYFMNCTNLEEIDPGENSQVTTIADRVFDNTAISGTFDLSKLFPKLTGTWNGVFNNTKNLDCVIYPGSFKGTGTMVGACFSGSACTHVIFGSENDPCQMTEASKITDFFVGCSDDMVVDFYLPKGVNLPNGSPWGNPNITINIIRVGD